MKHLLLLITGMLLTACGSRTYVERPVVVERPVYEPPIVQPGPVIIERSKTIEK